MLTVFGLIIAVGVVYNSARIALQERAWELASLRILGFSRAEVSRILLAELGIEMLIAIPLGIAMAQGDRRAPCSDCATTRPSGSRR